MPVSERFLSLLSFQLAQFVDCAEAPTAHSSAASSSKRLVTRSQRRGDEVSREVELVEGFIAGVGLNCGRRQKY